MLALYGPSDKRDAGVSSDPFALATRGHRAQVEDMVCAIREDRDPAITAESARHTVEILNAVYESARLGRPVKLGQ